MKSSMFDSALPQSTGGRQAYWRGTDFWGGRSILLVRRVSNAAL